MNTILLSEEGAEALWESIEKYLRYTQLDDYEVICITANNCACCKYYPTTYCRNPVTHEKCPIAQYKSRLPELSHLNNYKSCGDTPWEELYDLYKSSRIPVTDITRPLLIKEYQFLVDIALNVRIV